jgi:hypothetical protein
MTLAMAAGLTDKLTDMADMVQLIDDAEMWATIQKRVAALCAASIKLRHDEAAPPSLPATVVVLRPRKMHQQGSSEAGGPFGLLDTCWTRVPSLTLIT